MQKQDLRIVFMGTPEFAVETLQQLVENNYPVVGVVTQPDRPVGRHGNTLRPSPVKTYAVEHGIPVLQPEKMREETFMEQLRALKPNLQVVVAFRMLPETVWALPQYGTFNVHASLLPAYRGAAPINWALINGEKQTGVTTFFLDHEIDTGRVILQQPVPIPDDADVEYLYNELMHAGAQLALNTIDTLLAHDGCPPTLAQKDITASATPLPVAPKIFNTTCRIDWQQDATRIYNFIRGLSPIPGAWTAITPNSNSVEQSSNQSYTIKIYRARVMEEDLGHPSGQLVIESRRLFATCGRGTLEILELQMAGKRRMVAADFINGMRNIESWTLG